MKVKVSEKKFIRQIRPIVYLADMISFTFGGHAVWEAAVNGRWLLVLFVFILMKWALDSTIDLLTPQNKESRHEP